MMADLKKKKKKKKKKLLLKAKIQPANSNSGQRGDERHNIEVDGHRRSGEAKITDLVGKHLQTKEKTKIKNEVKVEMKRRWKQIYSLIFSYLFFSRMKSRAGFNSMHTM
jgi:hypothetical protein